MGRRGDAARSFIGGRGYGRWKGNRGASGLGVRLPCMLDDVGCLPYGRGTLAGRGRKERGRKEREKKERAWLADGRDPWALRRRRSATRAGAEAGQCERRRAE